MEGFIFVLIIWWVISAFAKNAQKQAKAKRPPLTREAPYTPRSRDADDVLGEDDAAVPVPRTPVTAAPTSEPALMLPPEAPVNVTPMQPQISVTPETDDLFAGSLHATSTEGKDPCHADILQPRTGDDRQEVPTPVQIETPGITLDFSEASMVKAFVMQEILTRPCDRHRRRA